MTRKISLTINGGRYDHEVEPPLLLIHYLREVAGLTGPHIGCETSICGACTVMLDAKTVKSCTIRWDLRAQRASAKPLRYGSIAYVYTQTGTHL